MADFELKHPGGQLPLPVTAASEGPSGLEVGQPAQGDRLRHPRPGFRQHRVLHVGDHLHRRRRGHPALPRLPDRPARREVVVPRGVLPADLRRAAHRRPSSTQFSDRIRNHTLLHEDLRRFFDGFPRDAHPMAVLSSAVSALSTFYQDSLDPFDRDHVEISTVRLMAKLPTIASYAYKKSIGQPLLYPDNSLGYVENFLRMTFGVPGDAVRGRPDDGQGPRHALRPARRPRAELLDVDGAAGRLQQRQPVRLGLGRRQRAVRPAARRRQPGRAGDAAGDPRRRRRRRRASSAGSRTRSPASS